MAVWWLVGLLMGRLGSPEVMSTIRVRRAPFRITVEQTGTLRPRDPEVIPGPMSGQILWVIDEGKYVKKGERVAIVDDQGARDWADSLALDLAADRTRVESAALDVGLLQKTLTAERDLAEIDLKRAELTLRRLREAPTSQGLALARLARQEAALKEQAAKNDLERREKLAKEGVASGSEVTQARLADKRARAMREQTDVEYELTARGSPAEDVGIAEEKVRQARIHLEQIEKTTAAQLAMRRAEAAVAVAKADQTSETLSRFLTMQRSAEVLAPTNGTVLYNIQWGRPEEGKRVWKGDPFLDVVNLSRMSVETRVSEVDLRSIGIGQKVIIHLEAFPDREFHGRITRIAGLAIDRSEGRQTSVAKREMSGVMIFDVVVEIDEADPALRPTMTANLEIVCEGLPGVISVPYRAIVERGGKKIVYVRNGLGTEPRPVTTGITGNSSVVVEEGLKEGDVVCILKRNV